MSVKETGRAVSQEKTESKLLRIKVDKRAIPWMEAHASDAKEYADTIDTLGFPIRFAHYSQILADAAYARFSHRLFSEWTAELIAGKSLQTNFASHMSLPKEIKDMSDKIGKEFITMACSSDKNLAKINDALAKGRKIILISPFPQQAKI